MTVPGFRLQPGSLLRSNASTYILKSRSLFGTSGKSAISRHAANLGVAAVAAVNPNKRKTYCLAYYGQHKLIPYTGEDAFPDLSDQREVAMTANVRRFSGTTAAVDIEVFTPSVPGAASFNQLYAIVSVRYMLVPEEEFEAQMAGTLSPEAVADYFAHAPLAGISPYVDPVYLEDIAAPEPDVRIGHMCIDNPCMVKGHQFGLPVAVVAGNVFDTISLFGPSPDESLAFTLVSGTLKCSRMVQLGERVTIRTERPSPRKFLSEVLDKDGASICRFNLDVAIH